MTTPEQRKALIRKLLKGIETGDPASVAVVDEAKYIQHNSQTHEGSEGEDPTVVARNAARRVEIAKQFRGLAATGGRR